MADENKLSKFQAAVFAEVDTKVAQIKQEAEVYKEQELEKNKDVQLGKSYNLIQRRSQEIKKQCKRSVAKFSLDSKCELLTKRNELTSRIFDNVYNSLTKFVQSSDYNDYLLNTVKKFNPNVKSSDIEIMVSSKDIAIADQIEKACVVKCHVVESKQIKLGGFIARDIDNGIYFDETLEQKLADQKAYFIQHSKLDI